MPNGKIMPSNTIGDIFLKVIKTSTKILLYFTEIQENYKSR